ncbi:MAG TPA: serine/threonine-protein kinase [Lacipirellulaceae bacterium]|nr:serine/threonine-protein kinase [Lacipirellulaceae bacterium]
MFPQDPSPSSDQPLLDEAIAEYLRAEAAGRAGDRQQWLDRYPECADELAEFLDDHEGIDRLMMPIRSDQQGVPNNLRGADRFATTDVLPAVGVASVVPEPPRLPTTRYRPLQFLFHAGGAETWLAVDETIGREVALKVLRSVRESERKRFFVDAHITGLLEHPNIVPIYDSGTDNAGQPFCVMKLIRARPLKDAIAECHKDKRASRASRELAFRRLLQAFVSVSNAIAFAHGKGVLHRDLKPDNVMLGEHGETLVVNWGSAKLAPEGAKGRADGIDEASDIYLLGATLYQILTGRPPRQGSSSGELIDLAVHAQPAPPRKVNSRVPRPLQAICLKAMSYDKKDRYQTPLALAEDVERYLAGQPTIAYREPLLKRALRWIGRR